VAQLPFRRWREVEVHLVDLDIGFDPPDWSQQFVDRALPRLIEGLPARADHRALMAWTLGRGPSPTLERWGQTADKPNVGQARCAVTPDRSTRADPCRRVSRVGWRRGS
jgi:hypothetical protein